MKVTRISLVSGNERTIDMDITYEQIMALESGGLIQNVMPHLTDDEREFFLTGISPDEWDEIFKDNEE